MKANTAVAFLLASVSVLCFRVPAGRPWRRIGAVCAVLVIAIGASTLLEYAFGWKLGVDRLLFADVAGRQAPYPGRPAVQTAAAFVLSGGAVLLWEVRFGGWSPTNTFALAVGAVGVLALLGYATGTISLYDVAARQAIAVPTALALMLLGFGVLHARPDRGAMASLTSPSVGGVLRRRLLPMAILVPVALAWLRLGGERLGLYGTKVGAWLFAVAVMATFAGLAWFVAQAVDRGASERKRAEKRFAALLDSAPDAMVIVTEAGEIVLANAQTEKLLGYRHDELVGKSLELLLPERHREAHAAHRAAFNLRPASRPMGVGLELRARGKDGLEVPVEISLSPLETEDGMLVSAAMRDITERRRVEERVRHLAAIVEHTDDAVLTTTSEGVITDWNAAAGRMHGYTAQEAIGRGLQILIPAERQGEEREILRRVIAGDEVEHYETIRVRKDGSRVDVSLTVSPIRDALGAVVGASAIARDISERKRFEGRLQYLADHDPLTGLFNRRRLAEELERELAMARRQRTGGAVLAIDLDHFKYINDSLGHSAGDELITRAAETLHGRLRSTDILARMGGDEFVAILPGVDASAARVVAAGLLQAIRSEGRIDAAGGRRRVTASIGIAPFVYAAALTAEELLMEADIAMYDAKEAGRDRAATYEASEDRQRRIQAPLSWVERIHQALDQDRFTLHAQPILSLDGDPRPRHELLLRMIGDDGEPIAPGAFLAIAERFGLIQEIDRWVLHEGIRLLATEQQAGREVQLQLNLSARSITEPELPELIDAELRAAGAAGHGLCFEVTETAAIVNVDRARRFAAQLHELGCQLALDDFGAGFASFYYLKHLAFDYLKIDGEFIQSLPHSRTNQLIVQSIVEITHRLDRRTIAEFVSDRETAELLRDYGVDYGQGFYIGKPRPLSEIDLAQPVAAPA